MIPDFGDQASFVWSAYAIVFGALFLMIFITMARFYVNRRKLARLDQQIAALDPTGKSEADDT